MKDICYRCDELNEIFEDLIKAELIEMVEDK